MVTSFEHTEIVEFFGLPRTGKTTAVEALVRKLNKSGIRSEAIRERASACPIKNKMSPLFNYWTAISQMREYIEACEKGVQVLVADRGILDSAIWLYFKNRGGEYEKEVKQFKPLLHNQFMNDNTRLALFFDGDIEKIIMREQERRFRPWPATVVNRQVLEGYRQCYRNAKPQLESITTIAEIDTSSLTIPELLDCVAQEIKPRLKGTKIFSAWA